MIKILVVEDEFLMRERLVKAVDWSAIGCEVADAAENGEEAVEIINSEVPDIVLTDIRMPKMDGLELSEFIMKEYPFIKVLIMTGYSDFSYAQKALKVGVKDYILKPSDRDEILGSVGKVADLIIAERKKYLEMERQNKTIAENLMFLKAKIFDDIINGYTFDIEEQNSRLVHIINKNSIYVIISVEMGIGDCQNERKDGGTELNYRSLKRETEEFCLKSNYDFIVSITGGFLYIILFFDDGHSASQAAETSKTFAKGLQQHIKQAIGLDISIGVSRCCVDINELGEAYREAVERMKQSKRKSIVDALEYINKNYNGDISLTKVAEHIHVHPVYLGRLLRKELKESFSDILLRVRIENAKKLLRDINIKAYEIAYSVGINDPHYFSQVFKKYTGLTPTEYRESIFK